MTAFTMSIVKQETDSKDSQESTFVSLQTGSRHEAGIHGTAFFEETFDPSQLLWVRIRRFCRDPFSEFMGTMILVLFGDGVVAQVVLSNGQKGNYQSISWGWGCASSTPHLHGLN